MIVYVIGGFFFVAFCAADMYDHQYERVSGVYFGHFAFSDAEWRCGFVASCDDNVAVYFGVVGCW